MTMEGISIPDRDVASLDHVAEGVSGLRIVLVNVFAVATAEGWTLIDGGLNHSASRIRSWAEKMFPNDSTPRAILLTHGHFDHVGALKDLVEHWDVPVYAHSIEMPYVTGTKQYPAPDPSVGGGVMSILSPFYPRGPIDLGTRVLPLPAQGRLPGLPDWRWIHTPGHTDGHVSFFREKDRTLIVGDAFCTTKAESVTAIATQRPELHGPPAYYTSDWDRAQQSVELLAALRPETVAPGHGMPMAGAEIPAALSDLARNFDQIARPHHHRAA